MTINERLFDILKQKKLKQTDLANKLKIDKSVITAWKKRGNSPPANMIVDIADFLGVEIFELLGIESETLPQDEQELLRKYNILPPEKKELALTMIRGLAKDYETVHQERQAN